MPLIWACSSDSEDISSNILAPISTISLDASASSQSVELSRNTNNATAQTQDNAFWISDLKVYENKVTFKVIENIYYERGHRVDTVLISEKGHLIGKFAVTQARNRKSNTNLVWAVSDAPCRNQTLELPDKYDGLKNTIYVYNLEKTTGGKDSYKNYPAFAYCIDMNADPENNMEWYLPSYGEVLDSENRDEIFKGHVYWWNADNFEGYGFPFGVGSGTTKKSKGQTYWVYAFHKNTKEK